MTPIREYECLECKKLFEIHQKMDEEKLTKCEACGGELQMIISHSSFHLKGSGFYTTDYKRRGK